MEIKAVRFRYCPEKNCLCIQDLESKEVLLRFEPANSFFRFLQMSQAFALQVAVKMGMRWVETDREEVMKGVEEMLKADREGGPECPK